MVSDLPRIGEWSPECEGVDWEGDVVTPVEGSTFVGHNAVGPGRRIRYSRHGRVLVADRGREFAFITDEGGRESTVWRYRFEPEDGGTRITESYEVRWIPLWARILDIPTNRPKHLVSNMGLSSTPLPMNRVHLLNPSQTVTIGDRRLTAVKPPLFDNPITTGFLDDRTGALFSSDCFGALLPALPDNAADLDLDTLRSGQI